MKRFVVIASLALSVVSAHAEGLNLTFQTVDNRGAVIALSELQRVTLENDPEAQSYMVHTVDGASVTVTADAIGRGLTTNNKKPLYVGSARLFGEELTLSNVRFINEDKPRFVVMQPEIDGQTTPGAQLSNRLVAQNVCAFFGYIMTGYKRASKWSTEQVPAEHEGFMGHVRTVHFGHPGVYKGEGSVGGPGDPEVFVAKEIRCSTGMHH
ncbi:MAG TPA: hypothetical protein VM432_10700 [Bdellovibrionales bacterium]|nr:hypothetical protein [Bdellovibrionales bacterium]